MLISYLASFASRSPNQIALSSKSRSITYGSLPLMIAAAACRINKRDPSENPVMLLLPECVDWVVSHLALRQLGRATVCVDGEMEGDVLVRYLRCSGVSSILGPDTHLAVSVPNLPKQDGAAIVFLPSKPNQARGSWKFVERDLELLANIGVGVPIIPSAIITLYHGLATGKTCHLENWLSAGTAQRWAQAVSALAIDVDEY